MSLFHREFVFYDICILYGLFEFLIAAGKGKLILVEVVGNGDA